MPKNIETFQEYIVEMQKVKADLKNDGHDVKPNWALFVMLSHPEKYTFSKEVLTKLLLDRVEKEVYAEIYYN